MNRLEDFTGVLGAIEPFSGVVPKGFFVDFLGTLIDARFHAKVGEEPAPTGGNYQETRVPRLSEGEGWFEVVDWVMAAREARGRCVMMTLGALYGGQAVGFYRTVQQINPMPCTLVAAEAEPTSFGRIKQHFRDNGIDPDAHWVMQYAIHNTVDPVLFPVGAPGSGSENCFDLNVTDGRRLYADYVEKNGLGAQVASDLLLTNSTGLQHEIRPGGGYIAEIKLISAITLRELLAPFDFVDYVESDLQHSEVSAFPPYMDLLNKKVRRIHLGTHSDEGHHSLLEMFEGAGWEIVFNYEPNRVHETVLGAFKTIDGVLTVRNPAL